MSRQQSVNALRTRELAQSYLESSERILQGYLKERELNDFDCKLVDQCATAPNFRLSRY
jgi:hypothetical protein